MSKLVDHVILSLEKANLLQSKINREIKEMQGMTGIKTRHFYNNLCSYKDARYFEIGVWAGSSICSAMCNNEMYCLCVDNWSQFPLTQKEQMILGGTPKDKFLENFSKFKGKNEAAFIEADCWEINAEEIAERFKFNIYLFDGEHDEENQFKALNHYQPCLEDEFIFLVDDWNMPDAVKGTKKSIEANNFDVIYKKEIFTEAKNGVGLGHDWWNGIGIFVLRASK